MTVLEITSYGRNTLRRLRRELRILDPMATPGLAPAYELDRFAPTPTLVTGDLPDVTLDDLVSISPLPAAAAIHSLQDVADTLEAMHDSGLAHGALRPDAVFVLPDGRAALALPGTPGADRRDDARDFAMLALELLAGVHPLSPEDAGAIAASHPLLAPAAANVLELALTIDAARRPLPHALMVALDVIPAEEWPTNGLHPAEPNLEPLPPLPRVELAPALHVEDAAEEVAAEEVSAEPEPSGPLPVEREPSRLRVVPRPSRRRVVRAIVTPFVVLVGLVTVFSGGGYGAWLLFASSPSAGDPAASPPHVRRVSLLVTPPQALCPNAAMHITATIVADGGPGELELRWRLPDGSTADTESFAVDGGRRVLRTAIDLTLTGEQQLLGKVVAVVNGARASAPIRYLCPSAVDKQKKKSAESI
jgi:hypothetical protein